MQIFGMVARHNTTYQDLEEDGTPVNRIRALFGSEEGAYESMWAAIHNEVHPVWQGRLKVMRSAMKSWVPYAEGDYVHLWMQFHMVRDPCSGDKVIYSEFLDITRQVEQEEFVREAKKREHAILQSMIPEHIIDFLVEEKRSTPRTNHSSSSSSSEEGLLSLSRVQDFSESRVASLAEHHNGVTVLFTDIVGFTEMTSQCAPTDIMKMLNNLFTMFDERSDAHHIYKVETIGDAYMCAAGLNLKTEIERLSNLSLTPCTKVRPLILLLVPRIISHPSTIDSHARHCITKGQTCQRFHATRMLSFARDILKGVTAMTAPTGEALQIRVGMHTGDCVTGMVGIKMPRFCLFGDTVNTASRMESNGIAGRIHVSEATKASCPEARWEATGGIEAKGKGVMQTYLYAGTT